MGNRVSPAVTGGWFRSHMKILFVIIGFALLRSPFFFYSFFFFSYAVFLPVLPAFPVIVNIAPIKTKLTQFLYVASFLFHPSFEVFLKKENVEENSGKWGAIFRGHPGCTFG